jgi:hypothetical protein
VLVHAAAINFPDVLIAANRSQVLSASLSSTSGSEFAGVVAALGRGVAGPAKGHGRHGRRRGRHRARRCARFSAPMRWSIDTPHERPCSRLTAEALERNWSGRRLHEVWDCDLRG